MIESTARLELVRSARKGDRGAFSRLVELYERLVFTLIVRVVRDEETARDLSQETFLKAYRKLRTLRKPEAFVSWLCSVARRTALDYVRRSGVEITGKENLIELESATTDPDPLDDTGDILRAGIERLSPRDRQLLTLAYFEEMSLAEVGEVLGIPERNVRVYVHRARKRLREQLRGYEDELLRQIG